MTLKVSLCVFRQVVGTHEPFVALGTGEPLLACVGPKVPLQLVGPGEALAAEKPVADERSLPSVPAKVRLQVACLPVHLAAPRDVAVVQIPFSYVRPGRSKSLRLLAVGTVTDSTTCVPSLGSR